MLISIVLNDMQRSEYAAYGFRSWMLQDIQEPYEVILNLFNSRQASFESLAAGRAPTCCPEIKVYDPPRFFNIAAANNLGLHFAAGEYVVFANSDIIYPSSFLRVFIGELRRRALAYAVASRVYLTLKQTRALRPAAGYSLGMNFDYLGGYDYRVGRIRTGATPWVVLKQIATAVGGFDPKVVCHEDTDFNNRVMHYLRRMRRQDCLYAAQDLYGYHVEHPPSELYAASAQATAILEPRRRRLRAEPGSADDVMPTRLDLLDALKQDLYQTQPIYEGLSPKRFIGEAVSRLRGAGRIMIKGQ